MATAPRHQYNEMDSIYLNDLYRQVVETVKQLPKSRITVLRLKVFILPLIYILMYLMAITQSERPGFFYLLYALMGIWVVVIFINLIHEACHGNIFTKSRHNQLVYYIFDFLGANSYIWKQRHLILHHRFPNTNGWDADIEQKGPVSVFPYEPIKSYQRFQHLYVFFLYPLFMLNWLFVRDFRDYTSKSRIIRKSIKIPTTEIYKLIFFKSFYLFMIVGIPWLLAGFPLWQALMGFLILTIVGSLAAMFVLLTPHINTGNVFPHPDEQGTLPFSWLRHQLSCTNDISATNWITRHLLGNFNYHVAHHIFPKISSVYAPEVTQVLERYAHSHNLPYRSVSLGTSFRMHYQLIKNNAMRWQDIEL
jgi:linoleoyl-CoA desaturase